MGTKEQYDFFARLYDLEEGRAKAIVERAKWYLSLTTLYSALVIFITEKLRPVTLWQFIPFAASSLCFLGAFGLSLWAVRVTDYADICVPEDAYQHLIDTDFDQDEFFTDRMSDYTVAVTTNIQVGEKQATILSWVGLLLLGGLSLHAVYFGGRILEMVTHGQEAGQVEAGPGRATVHQEKQRDQGREQERAAKRKGERSS